MRKYIQTALGLCLLLVPSVAGAHHFDRADGIADVIFLGDTSFGENYQDRLRQKGNESILALKGYDYFISNYRSILDLNDLVVANLETPITDLRVSPFSKNKEYLHYADVVKTPRFLKKYNIQLVSLANNHSKDFGDAGLIQTLNNLQNEDIEFCGAGATSKQAGLYYRHEINLGNEPVQLVIICAFEYRSSYDRKYEWYAGKQSAGVNRLSVDGIRNIVTQIRSEGEKAFVITFQHWGPNYRLATDEQITVAHQLVAAGVDAIVGHGSHLMQEVEQYRQKWILYSLGNFVFGSPGRYQEKNAHPYSLVAKMRLSLEGSKIVPTIRLYPIFSDNRKTNYRSRFVTEREFSQVVDILTSISQFDDDSPSHLVTGEDIYGRYIDLK